MSIKNVLKQSSWFMVNKPLAKEVGVEAALFYSYLCDKADFFQGVFLSREDHEWFFLKCEEIEVDTSLSYRIQKSCIHKLENVGILKTKLMGVPRKLYFTISGLCISQNVNAIIDKNAIMALTKTQLYYNKELNIKNQYKEPSIISREKQVFAAEQSTLFEKEVDDVAKSENEIKRTKRPQKKERVESHLSMTARLAHSKLVKYWCEEFKNGYVFTGKDAKCVEGICKKLYSSISGTTDFLPEPEALLNAFKMICQSLRFIDTFYHTADLSIINSKYNTIIEQINNIQNGKRNSKKSRGAATSSGVEDAINALYD